MSLIDRYVAEVGRRLPEKDRSDIEAEIRSMIQDMIEERGAQATDEKTVVQVLEELGDPRRLAAQYAAPKHYVIGPAWYIVYIETLKRVLYTALPVIAAIRFVLALTENPLGFGSAFLDAIASAFNIGVQIVFWITVVFVFLERSEEAPASASTGKQWTVSQLPELPRKRQISVAEAVMNIAVNLFLLLWIGLPFGLDRLQGDPSKVPFLNPDLWNFWVPVLFVIVALTLVHEILKLKIGNWTPTLTAANVILGIVSIVFIITLVSTQSMVNPEFLSTLDNVQGAARLRETVQWSIGISAAVMVGIYIWSMSESIRKSRQLKLEH